MAVGVQNTVFNLFKKKSNSQTYSSVGDKFWRSLSSHSSIVQPFFSSWELSIACSASSKTRERKRIELWISSDGCPLPFGARNCSRTPSGAFNRSRVLFSAWNLSSVSTKAPTLDCLQFSGTSTSKTSSAVA